MSPFEDDLHEVLASVDSDIIPFTEIKETRDIRRGYKELEIYKTDVGNIWIFIESGNIQRISWFNRKVNNVTK